MRARALRAANDGHTYVVVGSVDMVETPYIFDRCATDREIAGPHYGAPPGTGWRRTIPFPSGSLNMTNRPHGCSSMSPSMTKPRSAISATVASMSDVSRTRPCSDPGGIVGNHVTSVIDASEPLGLTSIQRMESLIG